MRPITTMTIMALLALLAAPTLSEARDVSIMVSGSAPVIAGDIPQARDEAIADALAQAASSVAGTTVVARTAVGDDLLESSTVSTWTRATARVASVLREGRGKDGIFRVEIQAIVSLGDARPPLPLHKGDIVRVMIEERMPRHGRHPAFATSVIADALSRAGVRVGSAPSGDGFLLKGRVDAVRGEEIIHGYHSAHADGVVALSWREKDGVLHAVRYVAVRGFGRSEDLAARDALVRWGEAAVDALRESLPPSGRTVTVRFFGIPGYAEYRRICNLLDACRFTGEVKDDGYNSARTTYVLQYAEDVGFLASRIDREDGCRVVRTGRDSIDVQWRENKKEVVSR